MGHLQRAPKLGRHIAIGAAWCENCLRKLNKIMIRLIKEPAKGEEIMLAEWWQDLATGNVGIDNQHKELFRKINQLLTACEERKGKEEVGNLLRFLNRYVREHFLDEESLQVRFDYPLYREHKQEHDAFVRELVNAEEQFSREGASLLVIVNSGKMALDWVRTHIYQQDKRMAEFVNNAEKGVGNLSDPGSP